MLWQNGNEQAFELIYKKYSVQLLAIAMQKIRHRESAQEAVQDTFLALYRNRHSLDKVNSLMAYLYVILKNRIFDQYRHDLVQKKYEGYLSASFSEADESTEEWIETRELERRLNEEIEKLPPKCRSVFKLSRNEYFSNKEIALKMAISENTVEQHMRKALSTLRAVFYTPENILFLVFLLKGW